MPDAPFSSSTGFSVSCHIWVAHKPEDEEKRVADIPCHVVVGVVEGVVLVGEDMGVVVGVCVVFNFLSAKLSI